MTGQSETAFGLIENSPVKQDLRIRDSDVIVVAGPARHAIDRFGHRHVLIPLADGQEAAEDRDSCGVSLSGRELVDRSRYERDSGDTLRYAVDREIEASRR